MTGFFEKYFEITNSASDFVLVGKINEYVHTIREMKEEADVPKTTRARERCFVNYLRENGIQITDRKSIEGVPYRRVAIGIAFLHENESHSRFACPICEGFPRCVCIST